MSHRSSLECRYAIDSCTLQLHNLHSRRPFTTKRPCLSDRATAHHIDAIDFSKLSLFDDGEKPVSRSLGYLARKRRRRGSRSVSGRSSDWSGTRKCSAVAYGTCSDYLPLAAGTDSSGELFGNGDGNWGSDVGEVRSMRKEREIPEKECFVVGTNGGIVQFGGLEGHGSESGYLSEPGYRGDAEFGYGDEIDEEEEDQRLLFWGRRFEADVI